MEEKTENQRLLADPEVIKEFNNLLMSELLTSERFVEFFQNNYDLKVNEDHENKQWSMLLIEKPVTVGPQLNKATIQALVEALKGFGVIRPAEAALKIIAILGQEASTLITTSTDLSLNKNKSKGGLIKP